MSDEPNKTETQEQTTEQKQEELHEFVFNGETVQLTKQQMQRAVYLGLGKAQEIAEEQEKGSKETKEVKEEPKKDKEEKTDVMAEIAKLRKEIEERDLSQAQMRQFNADLNVIGSKLKTAKVDPDFTEDLTLKIITAQNEARQKKLPISIADIADRVIETHTKRMERYQPRIDPNAKLKDKEDTEKTTIGGKSAGQEKPKPLGRNAFRSGDLAKRVGSKISKMLERATE